MRSLRYAVLVAAAATLPAAPAAAQHAPAAADAGAARTWSERISVSARMAAFDLSGRSEFYTLMDHALAPSSTALGTVQTGGELRVDLAERWRVVAGAASGRGTIRTVSRVLPADDYAPVRQHTTLELTTLPYVGAEWQLFRWKRHERSGDRLRVGVGAGLGVTRYRLRQWGDFVDVDRGIAYTDEFRSSARGTTGYASAGLELPVRRWLALHGELRRQFGSAPMVADFAAFDRLDLGGTWLGAGIVVRPHF